MENSQKDKNKFVNSNLGFGVDYVWCRVYTKNIWLNAWYKICWAKAQRHPLLFLVFFKIMWFRFSET